MSPIGIDSAARLSCSENEEGGGRFLQSKCLAVRDEVQAKHEMVGKVAELVAVNRDTDKVL